MPALGASSLLAPDAVPSFLHWLTASAAVALCALLAASLSKPSQRLPPGPRGVPVFGSLLALGRNPHRSLAALAGQYGPYMWLHMGAIPTLVLSSAAAAKEVLLTQGGTFGHRYRLLDTNITTGGGRDLAMADYGPYWKKVHKLVKAMFVPRRLEQSQHVRQEELSRAIGAIGLEGAANAGVVTTLRKHLYLAAQNVVLNLIISERSDGKGQVEEMVRKLLDTAKGVSLANYVPFLRPFWRVTGKPEIDAAVKLRNKILLPIIERHRERLGMSSLDAPPRDLLEAMLLAGEDERLTDEEMVAVLVDMMAGGQDTAPTLVEWALAELISHPDCQERLRAELAAKAQAKGAAMMWEADLNEDESPYLTAVVKETMRLHPPLPLLIPRTNHEPASLHNGRYVIPAHTQVIVNAWALGHDPAVWGPDANTFRPERFLNDKYEGRDLRYVPFGAGPRSCIGMTLGEATFKVALAALVQSFEWMKPEPSTPLCMKEAFGLTMSMATPLAARVQPCRIPQAADNKPSNMKQCASRAAAEE